MSIGGSREYILSLPDSRPKFRTMRTMDKKDLARELNGAVHYVLLLSSGSCEP